MKWEICELPILLPSLLWGISFACLLHGVKKPPKHHGSTRSRYQDLVCIPRPLCIVPLYCFFFRMVCPSVCVKKLFEALTGNFLPFLASYISHFICSYNMNYNFRPLRGPSIILIELHCLFSVGFGSFIKNISKIRQSNLFCMTLSQRCENSVGCLLAPCRCCSLMWFPIADPLCSSIRWCRCRHV